MDDESISSGEPDLVLIRVRVGELNVEKCLQFQKDEVLWEVKQQTLAALPKELQESFNYGLFMPPLNGKAGKFLDEERRLSEYPFTGPIGFLELKYKRRVYKMLQMDEKQLKSVNSKSNLKKFLEHVHNGNVEKINKMCNKGLDPNFHCSESGETPLCLAAGLKVKPSRVLIALVNGGAIVDFRAKDGSTALHKAVVKNNLEALRTLLELGASPNYKDVKGLTPLYLSVAHSSDVALCEMLLHDHALVGAQDIQGWQEVHQACRNGLVAHLEQLLFYGADMNAQNASGNTPLHVCALNNQESCARNLLFRGADKESLNFAGQTPYQVAVIAANLELADVIQNHRPEDVVPFKDHPKYNPRRRTSACPSASSSSALSSPHPGLHVGHHHSLSRTCSDASSIFAAHHQQQQLRLESPIVHNLRVVGGATGKPPSPSPSDRSLPPFSSGSSVSEASTGSGGSNAVGPGSSSGRGSHAGPEEEHLDSASALAVPIINDCQGEVLSLSSGVGTSSQSGSAGSAPTPTEAQRSLILPGMHVVCLENHSSGEPGSLHISQGDIIEVLGSTDNGLLEGVLRGKTGFFPAFCVQEVRLRNPDSLKQAIVMGASSARVAGRREVREQQQQQQELQQDQMQGVGGVRHFATATRCKTKIICGEPRSCVLHKGKRGFGFVLRGAKAASPLMEMIPSEKCPGLQYMDDVDPGGVADMAGILKGDFLLEINGEDVRQASHEKVVGLIRNSGDLVSLTVVTVALSPTGTGNGNIDSSQTLPSAPHAKTYASTLPRKLQGRSMVQPPPPPKRDPNTTLSVGRARAKSMVANLAAIEALDKAINEHDSSTSESVTGSVDSVQRMPDLLETTANGSSRMASSFCEDPVKNRVFNSVANMKRSKLQAALKSKSSDGNSPQASHPLHKDFHSTPSLATEGQGSVVVGATPELSTTVDARNAKNARSFAADFEFSLTSQNSTQHPCDRDDKVGDMRGYFTLPGRHKKMIDDNGSYRAVSKVRPVTSSLQRQVNKMSPTAPPPPDHPPPPPPQASQVVSLDTKNSDYARVVVKSPDKEPETSPGGTVRSSFKPSDNAKLYASPENVQSVGFRAQAEDDSPTRNATAALKKRSPTRANSMPPRPTRPQVLKRPPAEVPLSVCSPLETYNINGVNYTTHTTFRSPMTPDDPPEDGMHEMMAESEDLTPTAERLLASGPSIPEPDYDQSDPEYASFNGSDCSGLHYNGFRSSSVDDTPSRTLEKKKKKSVSFVMNEEVAAKLQQQQRASAKKHQESILKDPYRDRERDRGQQDWIRTPLVNEKYSQPIDKIPMAKLRNDPSPKVHCQVVSQQDLPVLQQVRVSEKDKIRIEVPPVVPAKNCALMRSNSSASTTATTATGAVTSKLSLHKSQSFCAEKVTNLTSLPAVLPSPIEAVGGISESEIQKARSQLKPSRSFPNDFKNNGSSRKNTDSGNHMNEEGDNSSSGVSSDQENGGNGKFVTYLPVDGAPTSNPVQPVLPDNVSESSDDVSEKSWILRAEQDPMGRSIISMKKMLHPKLQAIFDTPPVNPNQNKSTANLMTSSAGPTTLHSHLDYGTTYSSQTLPNRQRHHANHHHHHHHHQPQPQPQQLSKSASQIVKHDERSIDQSLALIHQHVNNLADIQAPTVVDEGAAVLAPPPGFSDSESFSDNDSLCSAGSQRRFGMRGLPKSNRNMQVQSSLTDQLKKERMTVASNSLMSRSVDSAHHLNSLSAANFATLPRKQMLQPTGQREFRTKPLIGWTVVDVCDWLDSLFMPEYKAAFIDNDVDGLKLASLTKSELESLGVIRIGHTMNIEKSLKRYLSQS